MSGRLCTRLQQHLRCASLSSLSVPSVRTTYFPGTAVVPLAFGRGKVRHVQRQVTVMAATKEPGHQVPTGSVVSEQAQDPEILAYQEHQRTAARLSHAEEARTLIELGSTGVISTLSGSEDIKGYPAGSVVQYAADELGRPIFAFSSLSPHTGDLRKDSRASLTVMAANFQGMSDARVTISGPVTPVPEPDEVRAIYKKRNPSAFWVDFGDFTWFRMDTVKAVRLVGGFARAGQVTEEEYRTAVPDPVAQFSGPVAGHMNDDHSDAIVAIVKQVVGITVDKAKMLNLDRLGFNVECQRGESTFKARIPFPREAKSRGEIKELIVELTRAAAPAAAKA
eukprot:jgi/Botrbrau1/13686/Bobra.0378s0015.1